MEMSLMWNAWLRMDEGLAWEKEVVISGARTRGKTHENYQELLNQADPIRKSSQSCLPDGVRPLENGSK